MPKKTLRHVADRAREAASTVAWRQWATLGSMAGSETPARSMIDPEALVLVSLSLSTNERRFWDVLTEWSILGARLLSVQRVKNLAGSYPGSVLDLVREYALFVHSHAGDARWRSVYSGHRLDRARPRRKHWRGQLLIEADPTLMLRLRLGLGVNMRADILALLLALRGTSASVRHIAEALGYTKAATRRATEDLTGARLIHVSSGARPDTYWADPRAWSSVLGLEEQPPAWNRWQSVFEFVAALDEWERSSRERKLSDYALEALGSEIIKRFWPVFEDRERVAGRKRGGGREKTGFSFEARTLALCDWMVKHA